MTSLEQLESETETSRVRVVELLEELRGRVSPGELVDQVVDFAGNGAIGDFARTLGHQVRTNPLACVLIGAGVAWLVMGDRHGAQGGSSSWSTTMGDLAARGRDTMREVQGAASAAGRRMTGAMERASERAADVAGRAGSAAGSISDSLRGAADAAGRAMQGAGDAATSATQRAAGAAMSAGQRAGDTAGGLSERAGGTTRRARAAATGATSTISSRVRDVSSGLQSAAGTAGDVARGVALAASETLQDTARSVRGIGRSAGDAGRRAGATMTSLLEEQPLIAAGLGLAIGALIGAALPTTETEARLMGETSDRVKSQGRQLAAEQVDKAKTLAGRTYEAAKEEAGHVAEAAVHAAREEGLPAGTLRAEHERGEHVRPEAK